MSIWTSRPASISITGFKIPANQPSGLYFYSRTVIRPCRAKWGTDWPGRSPSKALSTTCRRSKQQANVCSSSTSCCWTASVKCRRRLWCRTARPRFHGLPPVPTEIYFPVNGVLEPEIVVQPGEIQRWRIVNASAHRYLDLAIEDPPGCEADGSPPDIARRGQLRSFSRPQRDPDGTSCPVIPIRGERDGQ
jgi:hypothetical protein